MLSSDVSLLFCLWNEWKSKIMMNLQRNCNKACVTLTQTSTQLHRCPQNNYYLYLFMSVTQTSIVRYWCVWVSGGFVDFPCPFHRRLAASVFLFQIFSRLFTHIFSVSLSILSLSNLFYYCLPVSLSATLHLCSVSFSSLNLPSPLLCPFFVFLSVCSLFVVHSPFEGTEWAQ